VTTADARVGETLGERYRLTGVLGDGGSATVYSAVDEQTGVQCAVKVLLPGPDPDGHLKRRLMHEAETMRSLSHPNILRVFATGEHGDAAWIAMELATGGSIADRVQSAGPFSPRRSIQLALQALSALEVAHGAGVVHRDVKPENLLLQEDGSVKLADFGIALSTDQTRLTRAGFALGSLAYMAPEQRVDAHVVGPAADVYATGATLYHLMTGATPVDLFLSPPNSPRFASIPEGLVELIRQATNADPKKRFPDARTMSEALQRCLPHAPDTVLENLPTEAGDAYVPTQVTNDTAVDEEVALARLEEELRSDLDRGDVRKRRASTRQLGQYALAGALVLVAIVVGVGGRLSIEDWIERDEQQKARVLVPLEGRWRGTFGVHQAQLDLEGPNEELRGLLVVQIGQHEMRQRVSGAVVGAELVLAQTAGPPGLYTATLAQEARLDGVWEGQGREEPFHLVRVDE
jgi:serine/threonine-protein kinase